MPSIESIEHKLLQLDASSFQRLGDEYFSQCAGIKFKEFRPVGLTPSKRAPVKGTPDTLVELKSGKYVLIEYTTKVKGENKSEFLKKLNGDLLKCLRPKSTGVAVKDIDTIVLVTNQVVNMKERAVILAAAKGNGVLVELKDLHFWTQEIRRFSFLAKYLGLTSESKQVLTVGEFISEYEFGGVSTPLSNKFVARENELKNALQAIRSSSVYVVTGPPGVGKTKIILQAASRYAAENSDVELFCLKDKGSWTLDDVRTYFFPNKSYLVFIDDANRHLGMLRHMINTLREGIRVTLLLTVRDYALREVQEMFGDLSLKIDKIAPLEEGHMREIIYQVANFSRSATNRILELSQGNPRLALMAARIIKETNSLEGLTNASTIFEEYYASILKDNHTPTFQKLLKPLGVLSVFGSIDLGLPDTKEILKTFSIKPTVFLEVIQELEEMELVETDGDLVRIAEQNFQAYAFYKAFITEKKLSLNVLLKYFFPSHATAIKEIVISANNAFGYENIHSGCHASLITRFRTLQAEEDRMRFFDCFWFYCPTELLSFVNDRVIKMVVKEIPDLKPIESYHSTLKHFRLLTAFLDHNNENYFPALELIVEFTKKNPNHYKQLLETIKGRIAYDERSFPKYTRQQKFLTYLTSSWTTHPIYRQLFFDTANHFLYARFTIHGRTHKRNAVAIEQHRASLNPSLKQQRRLLWNTILKRFFDNSEHAVKVLLHYSDHRIDLDSHFIAFDAPYIFKIIEKHFKPSNLLHVLCVRDMADLFKRFKVMVPFPEDLKNKYITSESYVEYRVLSWSREQERFDAGPEIQRYYDSKANRVVNKFKKFTINELEELTKRIIAWHAQIASHYTEGIYNSLDVLSNFFLQTKSTDKGLTIIRTLAQSGNPHGCTPYRTLASLSAEGETIRNFLDLVEKTTFNASLSWYGEFIRGIKENDDTARLVDILNTLIRREKETLYFDFQWLASIGEKSLTIYNDVLKTLLYGWKKSSVKPFLDRGFFKTAFGLPLEHQIIKEAYVVQYLIIDSGFDFNGAGFKILMTNDNGFLLFFCKRVFGQREFRGSRDTCFLKGLQGHSQLEELSTQFLNFLAESDFLYRDNFYKALNEVFHQSSVSFIAFMEGYTSKNAMNLKRSKLSAEVANEVFPGQINQFLRLFLRKNHNVEHFKNINWSTMGGFFKGSVNISERYLSRWLDVREVLKDFESIKYLPHREHVDSMIYYFRIRSQNEAKELFLKKSFLDD